MLTRDDKDTISSMISSSLLKLSENKAFIDAIVEQVTCEVGKVYEEKLNVLNAELEKLKQENKDLKSSSVRYEKNVDNLEQYTRRNNIRIFGIPESRNESVDECIVTLCREKLNVIISLNDIDRSHRLGKFTKNVSRPVIVKFVSYRTRNQVFQVKKKLKDSGITIREDLTKSRLALFKAAAEKYSYKNVWTSDGRIVVNITDKGNNNKKFYINSAEDLI